MFNWQQKVLPWLYGRPESDGTALISAQCPDWYACSCTFTSNMHLNWGGGLQNRKGSNITLCIHRLGTKLCFYNPMQLSPWAMRWRWWWWCWLKSSHSSTYYVSQMFISTRTRREPVEFNSQFAYYLSTIQVNIINPCTLTFAQWTLQVSPDKILYQALISLMFTRISYMFHPPNLFDELSIMYLLIMQFSPFPQ